MSAAKQESMEYSAIRQLAQLIPPHVLYTQNWTVQRTNWLPFYWEGFSQTTLYTRRLDLTLGAEELWRAVKKRDRNMIRKAERDGLIVRETQDLDVVIRLIRATYARQGLDMRPSPEFLHRIYRAARARDACSLWVAETESGHPAAGTFVVRDSRTSYALASGLDPDVPHAGAQRLVDWRAVTAEVGRSETFDWEGSVIEPIERYVRSFGGTRVPYFHVYGSRNPWVRRLFIARTLAGQTGTAAIRDAGS